MSAEVDVESHVDDGVTISYDDGDDPVIGSRVRIYAGTIVYDDVIIDNDFVTGHNVLIRERVTIGDGTLLGTETVVDGTMTIGSCVSIQTNVYIPASTRISDNVSVGPGVVITNDPHPVRTDVELVDPRIENHASIGANAMLLPSMTVDEGAFVATDALVVNDASPRILAMGVPAIHRSLPEQLWGEDRVQ